jgi:hypothetical protein
MVLSFLASQQPVKVGGIRRITQSFSDRHIFKFGTDLRKQFKVFRMLIASRGD